MALGYCWNGHISSIHSNYQIILDTVEQTRPLAVLMSERSPDLQKVWNDALRDGRLDDWEFTRLLELQRNLEIDEQEMNITAARHITALERGSLSPIEENLLFDIQKYSRTKQLNYW